MGLLEDMKTLLTPITTDIFIGELPDTPDNCLSIFMSGGFSPDRAFGSKIERPSFQVRVRAKTAPTASGWALQVKSLLDNQSELTINSVRYISILQTGDTLPLGKDAKGRTELTINFQTKLER